jgi:hypothetical protein
VFFVGQTAPLLFLLLCAPLPLPLPLRLAHHDGEEGLWFAVRHGIVLVVTVTVRG